MTFAHPEKFDHDHDGKPGGAAPNVDHAKRKKFEDGQRLSLWLGEMYRSDQLGIGRRDDAFRRAHSTVSADPALLTIAKERIPELEKLVRVRPNSHVEKKQLEYLKHLTQEPA